MKISGPESQKSQPNNTPIKKEWNHELQNKNKISLIKSTIKTHQKNQFQFQIQIQQKNNSKQSNHHHTESKVSFTRANYKSVCRPVINS